VSRTGRRDKSGSFAVGERAAALGAVVLAALFFLAAAGFAQSPAEVPPETGAGVSAPAPASAKIAEVLEDETFRYDPAGKRDPFKTLLDLQSKKKDYSLLPPIQQLILSQVRIAGVVMDEVEGPRAMIKSSSGQSFVVKKGTIIGRNEGEIIEVSLQGIRIVEKYVDFVGRETLKEVFIKTRAAGK
jgi:type IV pilus assembly protein PilP